jgi:prepilin-type N-terminal cleavage/methylation domain-containing protein
MISRSFCINSRSAFTLIELLVVIAIIAILAVVVVLTLNPAELLRQSRDANRLSDMATLNSAINLYNTDQGGASGYSLGTATTSYLSIYDLAATSTSGDQCQGLGMPSSSAGYHCAASSTQRSINTQGWIPINFSNISSGSPLGSLPIDPINQTSSNLYYTYETNGSQYEVTAFPESQKYAKTAFNEGGNDPTLLQSGSGIAMLPDLGRGLVGYWPMDEGQGSTSGVSQTADISGTGNSGTWYGTASGTNGYYSQGKIGSWAGTFNGVNDYVTITSQTNIPFGTTPRTITAWINPTSYPASNDEFFLSYGSGSAATGTGIGFGIAPGGYLNVDTQNSRYTSSFIVPLNTWHFVVMTYPGSGNITLYLDGQSQSGSVTLNTVQGSFYLGQWQSGSLSYPGILDDVRIYNRALSAAEIQTLYNAEK